MNCVQAKSQLSPYLDGMLTGTEMLALSGHLKSCARCHGDYVSLRQTQQLLSRVGRRKVPEDLELKLRLAISREGSQSRHHRFDHHWIRLENAIRAFMVPATVGLASALVIFGFLMGFFGLPLQASESDVPLVFKTAPQLEQSAFGAATSFINDDSLVIEAYVSADGRVEDYRVLSNPQQGKDLPPQVKNMLIFTTFRPATLMGRPTAGTAVLSFSKISVKG
jgi:hypothetical protein